MDGISGIKDQNSAKPHHHHHHHKAGESQGTEQAQGVGASDQAAQQGSQAGQVANQTFGKQDC